MKQISTYLFFRAASLCLMLISAPNIYGSTFTVTSTSDNTSGVNPAPGANTGTLRQAIIDANANPGADMITFQITGSGLHEILLFAELPLISGPTNINGYSQLGAVQGEIGLRTITVQINGNSQISGGGRSGFDGADGLFRFTSGAAGSSLSGIAIYNTGDGIEPIQIEPGASNVHIWGNYIGLLANGTSPASPADYNGDDGVLIGAYSQTSGSISNIFVGTNGDGLNDVNEGNVIANSAGSSGGDGLQIGYAQTGLAYTYTNIRVSGNFIGIAADGLTAAPNGIIATTQPPWGSDGINLLQVSNILIGSNGDGMSDIYEKNIVSGNFGHGIDIINSVNVRVGGNYIGTDKNGNSSVANGRNTSGSAAFVGVYASGSTSNLVVGFDDASHAAIHAANLRNVVSGNWGVGIQFANITGSANRISGNYVGVTQGGNTALGNGQINNTGIGSQNIDIFNTSNALIGTDSDGDDDMLERNVISAAINGRGVYLRAATSFTIVAGNYIGTGADGTTPLGNGRAGVQIGNTTTNSSNNRVGSNDDGANDAIEANIIANNGTNAATQFFRAGVSVFGTGANSTGNRISRNVFYNNKGPAIDLNDDLVSPNDGAATANLPNLLLDYPVVTTYGISGTTLSVAGYISNCNNTEGTAGSTIAGNKTIQFYKVSDDGDQNGGFTNSCTRPVNHGEGIEYLGSINAVVNVFNTSFNLAPGASFGPGDKLTAITIDANGNTSEFGVVTGLTISGFVWNDSNGDAIRNGAEPFTNGGVLFANLTDPSGFVIQTVFVDPVSGAYSFPDVIGNNQYRIILTTTDQAGNTSLNASSLPESWVNTGVNLDGSDDTSNRSGMISLTMSGLDVVNQNFGIEQLPESDDKSGMLLTQPLVDQLVPLDGTVNNAQILTGSDPEDQPSSGSLAGRSVQITTLPTHGELWYNNALVTLNQVISGLDLSLLQIKLTGSGYTSTSFEYAHIDLANRVDPTPATYTLFWDKPLPVTLVSFIAKKEKGIVRLEWKTTSESNSEKFEVQRSINGASWNIIGQVATKNQGNAVSEYEFFDNSPLAGGNLYRLKMLDSDGTFAYSKVAIANFEGNFAAIFPNPVSERLMINGSDLYRVTLLSQAGKVVFEGQVSVDGITVAHLPNGIYLVRITPNHGPVITEKILVSH